MKVLNIWLISVFSFLSSSAFAEPVQNLSCEYTAAIISSNHRVADHETFALQTNENPGEIALYRLKAITAKQVGATFVVVTDGNGIYSLTLGIHELTGQDEIAFSAPPASKLGAFTVSVGSGSKDAVYEVNCKLNP